MKKTILLIFALIQISVSWANGITVNNVSLENFNESEGWVNIQFDIFWYNSWRIDAGPSNWDAAWVFAKYRANSGPWQHVTVSPSNSNIHPDFIIDSSNDNKGVFIYPSGPLNLGVSNTNNVNLGWDLNADSIDIDDTIEVKVFAIEMVYVPEGAFYLGNDSNTTNEVDAFKTGNTSRSPYKITSEDEIEVGSINSSQLYYDATSQYAGDQQGPIPAEFPKGFNAFYCMKYEISEQQYVDYFNTLPADKQIVRDITNSPGKNSDDEVDGNTVSWAGVGTLATTSAPDRACNYIGSGDLELFLIWAALRPMTELEFEKATRGPGLPTPGAYAWGNTTISTTAYPIASPALSNEQIAVLPGTNEGRAAYNLTSTNFPRPLRCGIFSTSNGMTNGTRENAGASYYGIMELSGNLAEFVISVGHPNQRQFNGIHGQGDPDFVTEGGANFINNLLYAVRGGGWDDNANLLLISDRTYGGTFPGGINVGTKNVGGRGVRTAD